MSPVRTCRSGGRPGYRWGDGPGSRCYTYPPGDDKARREAKRKAVIQGIAADERPAHALTGEQVSALLEDGREQAEAAHLADLTAVYMRHIVQLGELAQKRFALVAAAEWQPPAEGVLVTQAALDALAVSLSRSAGPIWTRIVIQTALAPLARVEIAWDVKHPAAASLIARASERTGLRLGDAMQPVLRKIVANAYEQGLNVRDTAEAIRSGIREASSWQADMLARCLPGETPIDTAVVRAVTRRWYEGDMVVLRMESGRELTATPNHPMLTNRGWLGTGELREGDHLVCRSLDKDSRAWGDKDITEPPPTIAEIFEAATAVGISERRVGCQPDFHGDGIDGDVDIAWPNRELAIGHFAPITQHLREDLFTPPDLSCEPMFCAQCGHLLPVEKSVCFCDGAGRNTAFAQDTDDETVADLHGCSEAMHADSSQELLRDEVAIDVRTVRRRMTTMREVVGAGLGQRTPVMASSRQPAQDGGFVYSDEMSDLPRALASDVELDRVISCRRTQWRGHVFNLHSPHGYFTANGAYTGNTDLNSLANGASKAAAKLSGMGYKTWDATLDARTRLEHFDAHAQTVPIDGMFTVGGEDADYPGDPNLSNDMACGCRCTLVYGESLDESSALLADGGVIMADVATRRQRRKRGDRRAAKPNETLVTTGGLIGPSISPDYVRVKDLALVASPQAIGINGTAGIEGKISDDNALAPRVLMPDSLSWPEMPVSFMAQTVTAEGHDGAEVAGRIDEFKRRRSTGKMRDILFAGELTTPYGVNEIGPMIGDESLRYVSLDLGASQWAIVKRSDLSQVPQEELDLQALENGEYALGLTSGKVKALTAVPAQAIEGAMVALTASADECGVAIDALSADEVLALVASGTWTPDPERIFRVVVPATLAQGEFVADDEEEIAALVASPAPVAPPLEWFETQEPPGKMPLTITKEGRVYGHLAPWDSCHMSFLPSCVPPPKSPSNYAYFHVCELDTADGQTVTVGKLMFSPNGGHADRQISASRASQHYDRTGMAGAYLRVADGKYGIWAAGALNPAMTDGQREEMRRELRLNPPSGDWRPINGHYELICALAVAVPGFPVPRATVTITASADGIELEDAIIASSGVFDPDPAAVVALELLGLHDEEREAEERIRLLAARAEGVEALAALVD